jgi:uncharacterized protein
MLSKPRISQEQRVRIQNHENGRPKRDDPKDEITHEIFTAIARNLSASISFEDIRTLAHQLDDVTDAIDAVGQRLALYHLLPATEVAHRLTRIIQAQTESLAAAVALIEHGKHRAALERHVTEIHRLEAETDEEVQEGDSSDSTTG